MLLTLSDDIRVILIKIADRLHNMRTLDSMKREKQLKIAGETDFMYAPLGPPIGLVPIKSELEDLSLRYRQPEEYAEIEQKLRKTKAVAPVSSTLSRAHQGGLGQRRPQVSDQRAPQVHCEHLEQDAEAKGVVSKTSTTSSPSALCWIPSQSRRRATRGGPTVW